LEREKLCFAVQNVQKKDFEAVALEVFHYQARYNPLYNRYLQLLGRLPEKVHTVASIPMLPISLFKHYEIQTGHWTPETVYTSSGTTGQIPSKHLVRSRADYHTNTLLGFVPNYGDPKDWIVLALLPAYLERQGSSLVDMADHFIGRSRHAQSGFFLHDLAALRQRLEHRPVGVPVLLLGVSFALLELAEQHPMDLSEDVVIMETGGMKGRRRELTRTELHDTLKKAFHTTIIHAEYGMTELLSQAYSSDGSGLFQPSPTLQALTFDPTDPFCLAPLGKTGQMAFIDLANIDSCSFIATEDLGRLHPDGRFEVLGRMDAAELRGCNLMVGG
jgi:hypothetical protein